MHQKNLKNDNQKEKFITLEKPREGQGKGSLKEQKVNLIEIRLQDAFNRNIL